MDPTTGLDPTKLEPLLIGPGGAIVALLLFIGYLMNEVRMARSDKDKLQNRYEAMRESRDEFRLIAGEAVRSGKRSTVTQVALMRHGFHDVNDEERSA